MPGGQNRPQNAGEIRLERRLVLASWFAAELGYSTPQRMLDALKEFNGEWGDCHPALGGILNGDSWRCRRRGKEMQLQEEELREYDRNIGEDLRQMNRARGKGGRGERVGLKYFQYLALLASEHFLARRESPKTLAAELNDFRLSSPPGTLWPEYRGAEDLNKLALWMATGSGKTLLMHLHYLQFMRRLPFKPDHVILLTPNEELSAQHLREMGLSGIPHFRHGDSGVWATAENAVGVLECTKLRVGKKRGQGMTEGTDSFEGRNLVFADEGHRGAGGDVFMEARRALAAGGFCFEYSATFGQALYAAAKGDLAAEYGRAIALDYSYKHFYNNGYGKDFRVLNLAGDPSDEETDVMMLGNLLSFCQQRMLYADKDNKDALAAHNLHSPLLLLLGTTVGGGKETDTDLARILLFLHRAALDSDGRLARAAGNILRGESGIPAQNGGDAFAGRLGFLRQNFKEDGAAALAKLRKIVFHADAAGPLRLRPVKNARGEIGLSVGEGDPFGLAFVGSPAKLRDLAMKRGKAEGMEALEDAVGESLFAGINRPRPQSPVNILIGAKKFMEGWSSWRVSGMGLLNVGRGEGSQIIQLFGRGVRLQGREKSLKRVSAEDGGISEDALRKLRELETLNIFGSRADFVARFAKFLEREGVTQEETLEVPIKDSDENFFRRGLQIPVFPPPKDFSETVTVSAAAKTKGEKIPHVTVDFSTRALMVSGENWEGQAAAAGGTHEFTAEILETLDFDELRRRLLRRREEAGFSNLLILRGELKGILQNHCSVIAQQFGPPQNFAESRKLHDIAFLALWKFAESLRRICGKKWEAEGTRYAALDKEYAELDKGRGRNFPRHYTVRAANKEVADEVRRLLENCKLLYKEEDLHGASALPRVYFSSHLYQPLLVERKSTEAGVKPQHDPKRHAQIVSPPKLNKGERNFVESLRIHLETSGVPDGEYFLLRNLSRGKGVGFFMDAGFFPDFILWIKRGDNQRIVFIEPHGLRMDAHPDKSQKVQLHKWLAEVSDNLAEINPEWQNLRMDSFIISQTDIKELQKIWGEEWTDGRFADNHILFPREDHGHIADILK